jgi:hypothetical protein
MRIVDCFPYFNEKELLELRIKLLYDHVDKFIICDADRTHSGKPKPFLCKDVIRELNLPQEKIHVVEVNLPQKSTNPWVSGTWMRERMQRNAASQFIEDGDVCFVGDCDEIINPKYVKYYASIAKEHPHNILRVPLVLLTGRADLRVYDENGNPREWNAPYFCIKSHLEKYSLSDIREANSLQKSIDFSDIFVTENNQIVESGWHFTWMGDLNRIKTKCSSFLHHDEVEVVDGYEAKINATDPLGRTDHVLKSYPVNLLPKKIFELERVKNFLIPDKIPHKDLLLEERIVYKKISKMGLNHQVVFDYLNSKFNKNEKNYRILDVGAGANPWSIDWITHVADVFTDPEYINNFNKDIKIFNVDINDPRDWEVVLKDVEENGKFDFVICSHTLEDVNNPKIACEMLNRIGKSGYISMPSKYAELFTFEYKSNCGLPYKGYHHHRWIYKIQNNVLIGFPKMNFYDYVTFDFDHEKAYGTEIAFLWEGKFNYDFINPDQMLDNRIGPNKLMDLFETDDLVLI